MEVSWKAEVARRPPVWAFGGRRSWLGLLVLGLILAGCGNGATDPGADADGVARVRIAAVGWDVAELTALAVTLDDGSGPREVRGASLVADDDYRQPHSPWLATAASGDLAVSVRVALPGAPEATTVVQLPLQDDWEWEVQLVRADQDPLTTCFGCVGSERVTDPPGTGGAVWVVWGGNSISAPVVY